MENDDWVYRPVTPNRTYTVPTRYVKGNDVDQNEASELGKRLCKLGLVLGADAANVMMGHEELATTGDGMMAVKSALIGMGCDVATEYIASGTSKQWTANIWSPNVSAYGDTEPEAVARAAAKYLEGRK